MNRFGKLCAFLLTLCLLVPLALMRLPALAQERAVAVSEALPYFTEPALSPDRAEIAFVSGGDIWTVTSAGGAARLLVSHPANDSRPLYSPDGKQLAFTSNRTGGGDIYVLTLDTGDLRRLTFDDAFDQLDAWARDGRWLYFSSTSRDVAGMNDLFRISPVGGTPMQVSADRYTNEYFCAPAPASSGDKLAFTARGIASGQWWRKGHSHIDEAEIWILRGFEGGQETYERVTQGGAKEIWPMWGADGQTLYYVSDRAEAKNPNGAQNIWMAKTDGRAEYQRVTNFTDGRVLWPNISYDGREIVFERNFRIWKLDTETRKSIELTITRRGTPAGFAIEHVRLSDQIQELALAPDGKKVAFVVRGEVFAASAADGGDAARVTNSPADEYQIAWSPDSRKLVYVSDRDGPPHLFQYDFGTNVETQLTSDTADDSTPRFSPDGKRLAFQRGAKELRVLDVITKVDRVLATGGLERPPIISDRLSSGRPTASGSLLCPSADVCSRMSTSCPWTEAKRGPSVSWLTCRATALHGVLTARFFCLTQDNAPRVTS